MRILIGALVAAVLCAGCVAHDSFLRHNTSYRLALDRSESRACYHACAPHRHDRAAVYARCLARCPDTQVKPGQTCDRHDELPDYECVDVVTYERHRTYSNPTVVAATLGFFTGVAASVVVVGEAAAVADTAGNRTP